MIRGFNHAFSKNMTDYNSKIASLLLQYTIHALFTSKICIFSVVHDFPLKSFSIL